MRLLIILAVASLSIAAQKIALYPQNTNPNPLVSALVFKSSADITSEEHVGLHTHKDLFSCKPAVKASFAYSASRQITLYPHKPLEAGTNYSCQANVSLLGFSSEKFTFTTKALQSDVQRFGKIIGISFNAPVDPLRLEKNLTVERADKLARTKLAFDLSADSDHLHFTALIKEDISSDTLKLTVLQGLHPSLKEDTVYELSFKDEPKVTLDAKRKSMVFTTPPRFLANDDGSLAMRLYMPNYFYSASAIKSFLQIKGVETFTVSSPNYIYDDERNKYNVPKDHYYYVDIGSDAFSSHQTYELTIKKGIKDAYSFQSRSDASFKVTMGDRAAAIMFEGDKPYLSSLGEVSLQSVNMPYVTVVIEKLLDQNYRYFTNFNKANTGQVEYLAKEIANKKFALDGKKNSFTKNKISLRPFMKKFSNGVYRIVLHYKDKRVSKSVFYSDIGLTAKVSKDEIFVWATQLSTSKPIQGLKLSVFSSKNERLGDFKTDASGIARLNQKGMAASTPAVITAQRGNEHSFLILSTALNDANPALETPIKDRYKAMVYLQSNLVRPGNDARILCLIKDKNYIAADKLPLKIRITDPANRTVYQQVHQTSSHGAIDLNVPIPNEYKTGTYKITVTLGKHLIGSQSFSVENFLPQRIKNTIEFEKDYISGGELLKAHCSSSYLFGAAASGLKATAKLTAVSKIYINDNYKNYHFSNDLLAKNNSINYLQMSKEFQLDANGKSDIFFTTRVHLKPPSILEAQIALTVLDDGRAVSSYKSATLYPYKTMVGLALEKPSLEKGQILLAQTLRLDPLSGNKEDGMVEAVLKKSRWSYTYDSNGYYSWHQKMDVVDRKVLRSQTFYKKTMDESGDYILELHDRLSGHSTTQKVTVRGWDYNPINPTNDIGKIQVSVKDGAYKKGDILKVDIKSPLLSGTLLVTLEDSKVHWHKVISVQKGSASLNIPLNFAFDDGLYLRTHMVRATNTPSTLIPFRAQSITFIKPDKELHRQDVTITMPALSGSNTKQTLEVKAKANSSLVVSLVDEGILQIKGQKAPEAFEFFQRTPKEKISLYDLYDQVMHHITKGKMLSFGGDDAAHFRAKRKHMGPKTGAKRVKPFIYWSGILSTDSQGKAKVTIDIPNFNGEAKIVALSFDANSIGVASHALTVKDDIIIKPTFPRFLHKGDEITVPVRIFNTGTKSRKLSIHTQSNKQAQLNLTVQGLTVEPNSSTLINGTLQAKGFGKAILTIKALSEGKEFLSEVELPVYSPFALETAVHRGETKKTRTVTIHPKYFSDTPAQLALTLSNSFLSQFTGSVNTLLNYPYGCAEQTSSKLLAMLYIEKFIQGKTKDHTKELLEDRKRFIQEGITKLKAMQKLDGTFGYWTLSSYVNPYASIYTSDVFLELKAQGFQVDNAVLSKIYQALQSQANGMGLYRFGKLSPFERIYAAYLLSNTQKLDRSIVNTLYDNKLYKTNLVTHYMMAAILDNAKQTKAKSSVLKEIEAFDLDTLSNEIALDGSFYSKSRDLAFALYIHAKHFQKNERSQRLLEAVALEKDAWHSTQSHAFMMRALQMYYKDEKPTKMQTEIIYNGTRKHYKKPVTLEDEMIQDKITIKPTQGLVNYSIEVANYVEKPLQHLSLKDQKSRLKLTRDFVDESGKIIDPNSLKIGDLFYAKISLQSNGALENIVVSNRIASCFEIVNERLGQHKRSNSLANSKNFKADHTDILDDKVLTFLSLPTEERTYNSLKRSYDTKPNTVVFFQPLRVAAHGKCQFPAVVAEAMYDGRVTAYDKAYKKITISQKDLKGAAPKPLQQKW